jgi:hypothetical protein
MDQPLGAYDHSRRWTLSAAALGRRHDQAMVSVHERLHHELQHTTPWGLLTRFAKDLAEHGVSPDRRLVGFYTQSDLKNTALFADYLVNNDRIITQSWFHCAAEWAISAESDSGGATATLANGTDLRSNSCGDTSKRSTSTPNAVAMVRPT